MEEENLLSEKLRLVLASASPRREELLRQIGFVAEILPSRVEEVVTRTEPNQVVMELSAQKAEEVAARLEKNEAAQTEKCAGSGEKASGERLTVIVGADTVVSIDGKILGKPADRDEAFVMLRSLQGRSHHVYTGVTLICNGRKRTFASETEVEVYPMTEEEIEHYIDSKGPMDKAGAYGIQGSFASYIKGIRGSYTNVMGLPVGRLYQELKELLCSIGKQL